MRRGTVLLQQHAGWMFREHWRVQKKRTVAPTGALKVLREKGIEYEDPLDVVSEPKENKFVLPKGYRIEFPSDEIEPYLSYSDKNLLIGGLQQAQVFCNAVKLPHESLSVFKTQPTDLLLTQDKLVKRCIRSSLLFDAYQEKLPKRKDPERPAWNFPRDYGITDCRKNLLLGNRLLQLCVSLSPQLLDHRRILSTSEFSVPFTREGDKVVLNLRADALILSKTPLEPPSGSVDRDVLDEALKAGLPDIYPCVQTVSLVKSKQLSASESFFPLNAGQELNIHTALVHYNPTEVSNVYDIDPTEDQINSRVLMKAYAFAVAQARYKYGDVEDLPEPLNTISCYSKTEKRNFFWIHPKMSLFETCDVINGIYVLQEYNPSVFKMLFAFYYNS
ncbi:uncharacterized protein LOC106672719 isoform X2 [Cimex lectularius]|uniref:39S ribosomal protein L37, mitochondrial n=1 Tax=Cimex lectularius TaxID=79782 RepID=A0A8I6THA2_CIMLE|nr:uncharacterized protein LOC106672719 isoform X2 [Cimex lectularius]